MRTVFSGYHKALLLIGRGGMRALRGYRVRKGSASDVCRVVFSFSPHGVLSSTNAPKVPLIIDLHIPTDRTDGEGLPADLAAVYPV